MKVKYLKRVKAFLKRANDHYSRLILHEALGSNPDLETLQMYAEDLTDTSYVCDLFLDGYYVEAYSFWYDLDIDPREYFPNWFCGLLEQAEDLE